MIAGENLISYSDPHTPPGIAKGESQNRVTNGGLMIEFGDQTFFFASITSLEPVRVM